MIFLNKHMNMTNFLFAFMILLVVLSGCSDSSKKEVDIPGPTIEEEDLNGIIQGSWDSLNGQSDEILIAAISYRSYLSLVQLQEELSFFRGKNIPLTHFNFRPTNQKLNYGTHVRNSTNIDNDITGPLIEESKIRADMYRRTRSSSLFYSDSIYDMFMRGDIEIYSVTIKASKRDLIDYWVSSDQVRFVSVELSGIIPPIVRSPEQSLGD